MPSPTPNPNSPELLAFLDWARSKYRGSTISQYMNVLTRVQAAGYLTTEVAAMKFIEDNYAASTWGLRGAAVKAFFSHMELVVAAEADARVEHGMDLTAFVHHLHEMGLKPSTAYRYAMAASRMLGLLLGTLDGHPMSLTKAYKIASDQLHDFAWRRYAHWAQANGHDFDPAWVPPLGGHGLHTRVIIAIRTLLQSPYGWPAERICESQFVDLIEHPEHHGVTLRWARDSGPTRVLHWLQPGRPGYEAFRTLYEWSKPPASGKRPLVTDTEGGKYPLTLPALRIALDELEALPRIEALAATGRKRPAEPPASTGPKIKPPLRVGQVFPEGATMVPAAQVATAAPGAKVDAAGPQPTKAPTRPADLAEIGPPPAAPPHPVRAYTIEEEQAGAHLGVTAALPPPPDAVFGRRSG